MKIEGGATIWARKTIDSDIFYNKPDKWFKIWFYLISTVNYMNKKGLARGTCFMKYNWIMTATKATKDQVKHCIEFLKNESMLATQKATHGFIINVLGYKEHQNLSNYESHTERNTKATQKPHKSHNIYKNYKNLKNNKKSTITLSQINNLISSFPSNLQPLINEYIDIARSQNKTEKISLYRQKRLIDELLLVWQQYQGNDIDETDYRKALKITVNNQAPNINYVRKVIKNIVDKRSIRMKKGTISS